jgi:hypothetical protein
MTINTQWYQGYRFDFSPELQIKLIGLVSENFGKLWGWKEATWSSNVTTLRHQIRSLAPDLAADHPTQEAIQCVARVIGSEHRDAISKARLNWLDNHRHVNHLLLRGNPFDLDLEANSYLLELVRRPEYCSVGHLQNCIQNDDHPVAERLKPLLRESSLRSVLKTICSPNYRRQLRKGFAS